MLSLFQLVSQYQADPASLASADFGGSLTWLSAVQIKGIYLMNVLKLSLCAAVATAAMAGASAASAEDAPAYTVAFNAGAATEYVFRGLDQSPFGAGTPEVFGGIDTTFGKGQFYLGNWDSTTGPSGYNGFEYDIYGGWKPAVGPVNFDLGFYFYGYTKSQFGYVTPSANTLEWKAGASTAVGSNTFGLVTYYSDDNNGLQILTGAPKKVTSWYTEADYSYTFKNKASVSAAYGYTYGKASGLASGHYSTWNVGVTYPLTDHVSLDARYIGSGSATVFGTSVPVSAYGGFNGGVLTAKVNF